MNNRKSIVSNPKFKVLMNKGRSKGFVTYKEVLKSIPNAEKDINLLDDLYGILHEEKIEVIE